MVDCQLVVGDSFNTVTFPPATITSSLAADAEAKSYVPVSSLIMTMLLQLTALVKLTVNGAGIYCWNQSTMTWSPVSASW